MSETSLIRNMSVEEYLEFEAISDRRHEFVDGQIFAMSGATEADNVICGNFFSILHARLRGSGCRAFINDMKVHVRVANSFYYPDIMVTCEPFAARSVYKESPVLIVEVLSPSTRQIDRREKLVAYRKLESLKEYVIVHQSKVLLENYSKDAAGQWQLSQAGRSDELVLASLPGSAPRIPVCEIYNEVEIPSVVEEEVDDYEMRTH